MAKYRIADLLIEIDSWGRIEKQARPYLTAEEGTPDIIVHSEAEALHKDNPHLSLDDCEYLSTGATFYRQLLCFDGMMLHSSCVVVDGKAYLFTAPSGVGKSTHVQLWLKLFGDRAYVLNDDKPALRAIDGKIYVYGTPWSGKYDYNRNERVELGGIAVVKRAAENSIRPLTPKEGIYALLNQTARTQVDYVVDQCLETIQKIVSTRKLFELSCNMDISAARLSYETMSGKRIEE